MAGSKLRQRGGRKLLNSDHLDKIGRRKTAAQTRRAAGGQNMAGPGRIIAGGFGRILA